MSDWDVDSYKTDFESEEHWELRRNFMLAHKDKLPEDEVVCLAQVFTNIELLGCRYPEETMQRVAELAKGVVEEFREKKKSCLKRTFVAASAAAVAKAKGQRNTPERRSRRKEISGSSKQKVNIVEDMGFADINKCIWDDFKISGHTNNHSEEKNKENGKKICYNKWVKKINSRLSTSNFSHTLDPISVKKLSELKPRFVFFLYDEPPVNLLQKNAYLNKGTLRWQFEGTKGLRSCSVYYKNIFLGAGSAFPKKKAKEKAAKEAIINLQSLCYTVKVKKHVRCLNKITPATLGCQDNEIKLKSGIGEQIMKLMGWEGGGLGVKQQGIVQPITVQPHIGRDGLGLCRTVKKDDAFKNHATSLIKKWKRTNSEEDLVFSSEFTQSQREILHGIASDLHLKSRSYGKDQDRFMVIYKKLVPKVIVERLLQNGGSTNRYELIIPTVTIS